MHEILQKQLAKFIGSNQPPPEWEALLNSVSDTYTQFEQDRAALVEDSRKLIEDKEKTEDLIKQSTLMLGEEQARLLASIDSLSLGFAIFDVQGRIVHINQMMKMIFDLKEPKTIDDIEEVLQKSVNLRDLFVQALTAKRPIESKNAPFERKFLRIFISPVILASNLQTIGGVMVVEDTTKEQEIDRAKSEFVVLASHQLRTPLTTIRWWVESLDKKIQKTPELHEAKRYVEYIEKGTKNMAALVQALLDVSRIEVGKLGIKPQLIKIGEVCHSVVEDLKEAISEKNMHVSEQYLSELPEVDVDPNLLRIVLQNLLTNAIKYTPNLGRISLEVTQPTESQLPLGYKSAKDFFLLKVSDSGYGISEDQQSKVFNKLFRADNIKLTQASGTGLGLYITKSIIESCDGAIWFESYGQEPDKYKDEGKVGTTFYVILPIKGIEKKEGVILTPQDEDGILYS
jgi:signal transduction histidine kinase